MDLCRQIDHMRAVFESHNQMRGEELDNFITMCYDTVFENDSGRMVSLLCLLNKTSQITEIVNRLDDRLQYSPAPSSPQRSVIPKPAACCTKCDVAFIKHKRRTTLSCGCKYHKTCNDGTSDCVKCEKVEEGEECSICLDVIANKDCVKTSCGHQYHKKCLSKWKRINKNCPLCRRDL